MKRHLTKLTLTASAAALALGVVACEVEEGAPTDTGVEDPGMQDPDLEDDTGFDDGTDDDF